LYYLTGLDNKFYFSKTLKQHLIYRDKYITNYQAPEAEETEDPKDMGKIE